MEGGSITALTRYEQETIISFNAEDTMAIVYTRDKAVMRKLDNLVAEFPDIYKQTKQTELDKTYSMPKSHVSYRKPRKVSEEQREKARRLIKNINMCGN